MACPGDERSPFRSGPIGSQPAFNVFFLLLVLCATVVRITCRGLSPLPDKEGCFDYGMLTTLTTKYLLTICLAGRQLTRVCSCFSSAADMESELSDFQSMRPNFFPLARDR